MNLAMVSRRRNKFSIVNSLQQLLLEIYCIYNNYNAGDGVLARVGFSWGVL